MSLTFVPLSPKNLLVLTPVLKNAFPQEWNVAVECLQAHIDHKPIHDIVGGNLVVAPDVDQLVAFNEDQVCVGTVGLYQYTVSAPDEYWLSWFAVDPRFQGQGFGRQLLTFISDRAKKSGAKTLSLWSKPHHSHGIYRKTGFTQVQSPLIPDENVFVFEKKIQ